MRSLERRQGRDKATSCAYQYQALANTPWSPLPPRFSKLATANMVDARLRLSSCPPLDCGERRPIVSLKLGDSTRGPGHREKKKKGTWVAQIATSNLPYSDLGRTVMETRLRSEFSSSEKWRRECCYALPGWDTTKTTTGMARRAMALEAILSTSLVRMWTAPFLSPRWAGDRQVQPWLAQYGTRYERSTQDTKSCPIIAPLLLSMTWASSLGEWCRMYELLWSNLRRLRRTANLVESWFAFPMTPTHGEEHKH